MSLWHSHAKFSPHIPQWPTGPQAPAPALPAVHPRTRGCCKGMLRCTLAASAVVSTNGPVMMAPAPVGLATPGQRSFGLTHTIPACIMFYCREALLQVIGKRWLRKRQRFEEDFDESAIDDERGNLVAVEHCISLGMDLNAYKGGMVSFDVSTVLDTTAPQEEHTLLCMTCRPVFAKRTTAFSGSPRWLPPRGAMAWLARLPRFQNTS
jgi:hypothetical protein